MTMSFWLLFNFQNMKTLPKRLQAQSSYVYQLSQPLSFYGYKEFELQGGLLCLKALFVLFLNRLL